MDEFLTNFIVMKSTFTAQTLTHDDIILWHEVYMYSYIILVLS